MTALKRVDTSCLGLGISELETIQEEMDGSITTGTVIEMETFIEALANKGDGFELNLIQAFVNNDQLEQGRLLSLAVKDYLIQVAEAAKDRDRQLIIMAKVA